MSIDERISVAIELMVEMEAKKAFLQELIDNDHLDEAALGITRQVIAKGEHTLSDKQQFIFEQDVLGKFVTKECRNGCAMPWSEMYKAHHNGGRCDWCNRGMNKYRDE